MTQWSEADILPHGDLVPLADDLWQVTGALPRMSLPRNMQVYRMKDGGLFIHSAIAMREDAMKKLESLGEPKVIVIPSQFHQIDGKRYKMRYPKAVLVTPAGVRDVVAKRSPVDATCQDALPDHGIVCHAPDGVKPSELVYEVATSRGRALLFNDILFNVREHLPGFSGFMMRIGGSTGFFGATRLARLVLIADKKPYAAWLRQTASTSNVAIVTMSHGDALVADISPSLENAAARLG